MNEELNFNENEVKYKSNEIHQECNNGNLSNGNKDNLEKTQIDPSNYKNYGTISKQKIKQEEKSKEIIKMIITLSLSCIGSSCLVTPSFIQHLSLIWYVIIMITICAINYFTGNILIEVGSELKIFNYCSLVKKLLGEKVALLQCFISLCGSFGSTLVYMILSFDLMKNFLQIENYQIEYYLIICIFFLLPLGLIQDISYLSFTSTLALSAFIFMVLTISIQSPWYMNNYLVYYSNYKKVNTDDALSLLYNNIYKNNNFQKLNFAELPTHSSMDYINLFDITKSLNSDLQFFILIASLVYSFSFHINTLNTYKSLSVKSKRNGDFIVFNTCFICMIIFFAVGILGYLTEPVNTPTLIFNRYILFENDYFMRFGKLFLGITVIFKIPISFNGMKQIFAGYKNLIYFSTKENLIFTILYFLVTFIFAVKVSRIEIIMGFIGGIYSVTISCTFPLAILYQHEKHKLENQNGLETNYISKDGISFCFTANHLLKKYGYIKLFFLVCLIVISYLSSIIILLKLI